MKSVKQVVDLRFGISNFSSNITEPIIIEHIVSILSDSRNASFNEWTTERKIIALKRCYNGLYITREQIEERIRKNRK